jgi:hypothetical protein
MWEIIDSMNLDRERKKGNFRWVIQKYVLFRRSNEEKKRTVKGNIKGRYISLLFMLYSSRTWMIVSESRM